jgi:heme/copper-type cytochrome/quinol oxidase subunit 3
LAVIFLIGQGSEYYRLLKQGFNISKSVFSTSFFTLTGFHGLHVLIGLLTLAIVLAQFFRKSFNSYKTTVLSAVGIYWHFVDIVWLFVFITVYILPYF